MKWVETHGVKPRTRAEKAHLRFRNGLESKQPYSVGTTRWSHVGDDWDVVAYAAAEERKDEAA